MAFPASEPDKQRAWVGASFAARMLRCTDEAVKGRIEAGDLEGGRRDNEDWFVYKDQLASKEAQRQRLEIAGVLLVSAVVLGVSTTIALFGHGLANEFMSQVGDWVILALACAPLGAWLIHRRTLLRKSVSATPRNGLGTVALVIGVVALLVSWTGFGGMLAGLLAEITGILAYRRFHRGEATNGGATQTAILLGFSSVVIGLMFNAVWLDFSKHPL